MAYSKSKAKGSRAELLARDLLRSATGLKWERTPLSGALHESHKLSGDIYVPGEKNLYTIEVKHYADSHINHLLINGVNHQIEKWWDQTLREAGENCNSPVLIIKHDRSKFYAVVEKSTLIPRLSVYRDDASFDIIMLEDWLMEDRTYIK